MAGIENRFHNSKIYKITDNANTKTYYGSTTQTLAERMASHRRTYRCGNFGTTASLIFSEFGIDNCKIELVESCKCENIDELRRIEGKYIKENDCINRNIAGRTKKEYDIDNHDKILAQRKEYRKRTPELHKKLKKQYYEGHQDQILAYQRQYVAKNKDKINEQNRLYREQNRDRLNAIKRERVICDCGVEYPRGNKKYHIQTQKHVEYLTK
jgi:hypothetical protein